MAAKSAVVEMRVQLRMRVALAMVVAVTLALTLSTAVRAATIVVNSLADPGAADICALRDAITAANTKTATNGYTAGTGKDTIRFSVTGTISLAGTLPQVIDSRLTINGPASPGITIDGGNNLAACAAQGKFLMSVSVPLLPVSQFILRELTERLKDVRLRGSGHFIRSHAIGANLACLTQREPVADESSYKINWRGGMNG